MTDFLWTFSGFPILLSKWETPWLIWCPSELPRPSPQGGPQLVGSQPLPVPQVYSAPVQTLPPLPVQLQEVSVGQTPKYVKVPLD